MKILAIDTSTRTLCLGAGDGDKVYEYNLELGTKLSELLVPTLKRVVGVLGWKTNEIDYFAAGVGPGSFTGLRVGLSAVKALSWSLNKPVAAVSSLDILARNAGKTPDFIIPIIDAKRGLFYSAIYRKQGSLLKRITPYMLLGCRETALKVTQKISAKALENSVILGDGLNTWEKGCFALLKGIKILDKDHWRLEARNLIDLAKLAVRDKKLKDAFGLEALYLYPKECQIRHLSLSSK